MSITHRQKQIAARLVRQLKRKDMVEEVREEIRKENEYMREKEEAQKPTRKQMETPFDL
jgi:hypothetical protein